MPSVRGGVLVRIFGETRKMVFIKFVRIVLGVIVVWLLFRLLLPRDGRQRPVISRRRNDRHRRHSKFVESSVIDDEDRTDGKTRP